MEMFFVLLILQSVNGYNKLVNHSIAKLECNESGGLASYTDFDKYDGTLTISGEGTNFMTLTEGESAWVQGYANYSTILSLFGCYILTETDTFNSILISENSKYICAKHCVANTNNTEYIALKANRCFCLTFADLRTSQIKRILCDTKQCQSWINRVDDTVNDSTNVYKIYDIAKFLSAQQCVYAEIRGSTAHYETDSCYSSSTRGFICTTSYELTLNETCNTYYKQINNTPAICFTSENSSWVEAKQQCCVYSGKLTGEVITSVRMYADTNRTYWTGMFRPFSVQNDSTSSCISATRVNNTLVLDPDDCSKEKRFLCKDNTTKIRVTTPSVTTSSVNTESTNQTTTTAASFNTESTNQTTSTASSVNSESNNQRTSTVASVNTEESEQTPKNTTVASKHNETNSSKSKYYIYIGIGVSVLFVVVVTIIIIVYKVRKTNIKTEGDAQSFENSSVCIEPDNSIDSKERYVSFFEGNLENKTKDICMQEYCYDTADQHSAVNSKRPSEETEYDRVHLVSKNKGKKIGNVDGNIYDHTKDLSDLDQYNVLGNIDRNKANDTYGKLQTKESTYDTMAQAKAVTTSFDTYAHLS